MNYDNWIRQQFRDNVPYDAFVRQLVTAKGSTWQNGAVTLYRDRRSPDEMATLVSQLFLGIRLDCAKCHHHPFERWSQRDFYQFSAYFAKVSLRELVCRRRFPVVKRPSLRPPRFVAHPLTGETMTPTPLYEVADSKETSAKESLDPRDQLADWMTSRDNDFFARVHVNRTWAILMGRGLVTGR